MLQNDPLFSSVCNQFKILEREKSSLSSSEEGFDSGEGEALTT